MTEALVSACASCGAEESLDSIIGRLIHEPELRGLVADVLKQSLPLGNLLMRYVRLHKPVKHALNMARIGKVLREVVPEMQRKSIERSGRVYAVDGESWKAAFEAVFLAAERGTLKLPLTHNGYLYSVLLNMADKAEAVAEQEHEAGLRHGRRDTVTVRGGQALPIGEALQATFAGKDPALAKIDADAQRAAPMPDDVRQRLDELRNGKAVS